ncbi:MAG: DUF1080 domain-containing protein [Candidatus Hydrogenedentes bacterium]|nr:DUF1080 domain-containing protein [Candidatus Hydrogenedentota bacterium]
MITLFRRSALAIALLLAFFPATGLAVDYSAYDPGKYTKPRLTVRGEVIRRAACAVKDPSALEKINAANIDAAAAYHVPDLEAMGRITTYMETVLAEAGVKLEEFQPKRWTDADLAKLTYAVAGDNTLSDAEKAEGWQLIFDGKSWDGWMNSREEASAAPVDQGCINPHKCGAYLMLYKEPQENFVLRFDFMTSPGANSGAFFRTWPIDHTNDIAYNGLEMQVLDSGLTGYNEAGALYDLVPNGKAAIKQAGQWNSAELTCNGAMISVVLNGEKVSEMNLDEWTTPGKRPDGTAHKFDTAWKDHFRKGYLGFQDHGAPVWYKNVKLKVLP